VLLGRTPNLADPLSKTPTKAHAGMSQSQLTMETSVRVYFIYIYICHTATENLFIPIGQLLGYK